MRKILIGAFGALNGIFLYLMKAPTELGRKVMDQLDGLRLYLETAEGDRLNSGAPEITADRFEALGARDVVVTGKGLGGGYQAIGAMLAARVAHAPRTSTSPASRTPGRIRQTGPTSRPHACRRARFIATPRCIASRMQAAAQSRHNPR